MYLIYFLNALNKNKNNQIYHCSKGHGLGALSVCIENNYTNKYENTSVCIVDNYTNEYENMSVCNATMNAHVRT